MDSPRFTVDPRTHCLQAMKRGEQPVRTALSPNRSGELVAPEFLILHCTGGTSLSGAMQWLTSTRAKASAHLVIDSTGDLVAQLVPFNVRAWHAGPSKWMDVAEAENRAGHTYYSFNALSIGIELVNPGWLQRRASGDFYTSRGVKVPPECVVHERHTLPEIKHEYWMDYAPEQIATLLDVGAAIVAAYPSIRFVLGHDEIAIPRGRKSDPGPALDIRSIESALLGRKGDEP